MLDYDENKASRVNSAKHIIRQYFHEGMEDFCDNLIVQDETWVSIWVDKTKKQQNRCWIAPGQPCASSISGKCNEVMLHVVLPLISAFQSLQCGHKKLVVMPPIESSSFEPGALAMGQCTTARSTTDKGAPSFQRHHNYVPESLQPELNVCDRFLFTR